VVAARSQEGFSVDVSDGCEAADRGFMSLKLPDLLAVEGVDVDGGILRPCRDELVVQEVNTENRVVVVSFYPLKAVEFEFIAPFHRTSLLVGIDSQFTCWLLGVLHLFARPQFLELPISAGFDLFEFGAGIVVVLGLGLLCYIEFLQDSSCVFEFLLLSFDQALGSHDILGEVVKYLLDK
jgi:hypothetical protein